MKLNASKTKTMIVFRSSTMHLQLPPLTNYWWNCTEESDDLVILGVTFDSKMTVEKHLSLVSRAASQTFSILRKSWRVFMIDHCLGDAFEVLSCQFWSTVPQCGARWPIHTLN